MLPVRDAPGRMLILCSQLRRRRARRGRRGVPGTPLTLPGHGRTTAASNAAESVSTESYRPWQAKYAPVAIDIHPTRPRQHYRSVGGRSRLVAQSEPLVHRVSDHKRNVTHPSLASLRLIDARPTRSSSRTTPRPHARSGVPYSGSTPRTTIAVGRRAHWPDGLCARQRWCTNKRGLRRHAMEANRTHWQTSTFGLDGGRCYR